MKNCYVYITTNCNKTVLYTGSTDNLIQRLIEHWLDRGSNHYFADEYHCYNLLYYEQSQYVLNAITREREIRSWIQAKKEALISEFNKEWEFLNGEIMEWPPEDALHRSDFYL